ncbi:MAG TPA: sigma-54-dependent Fis family transcriptional regulator, partial [Alphaproteobacteria bacterium]|nr:sigma-54-dependent Fis family transcriptional regulator [Alphaproteobacteria bacterium]
REIAMKAGQGDSRVFIRGAAGSGKEMLARHIHQQSKRTDQPFVVVNLSSGNVEELEVELFGVAGDKTARKVVGALEKAHQGTLYLEEIGQIPEEIQSALLRFLVNGQFTRKDAEGVVSVDCRVISSSMMNAEEIISKGHVRQDLFHRLNVVSVDIPSLHERRDDIPDLLEFFMHQLCMESGRGQRNFGRDAMMVMQAYSWPGNIRQLRNAVENILINMDGDGEINIEHLPPEVLTDAPKVFLDESMREVMKLPLRDAREVFEREYLMAQLTRLNGNVSKTAEFVGMERSALHRKLKLLGLRTNE